MNRRLADGRYVLDVLHAHIFDAIGMYDLDDFGGDTGRTMARINGMIRRMPINDERAFQDAMVAAVQELDEMRDIHPNNVTYHDPKKSLLWAVGRATGCSMW